MARGGITVYLPRDLETRIRKIARDQHRSESSIVLEALKAAGINSVWYVSPETAHEWQSWRRSLYQFAPLVFQN